MKGRQIHLSNSAAEGDEGFIGTTFAAALGSVLFPQAMKLRNVVKDY